MRRWLDALWVPHCVVCDTPEVHGLCEDCARRWSLRPLDRPLEGVQHGVALTAYDSATGDRLRRAKYGADRTAIRALACLFAAEVAPWLRGAVDAVVPAPSTWVRRARRGFAVAAVLADAVSRRLGVPRVHALAIRSGSPNAGQGAVARRTNLRTRVRSVRPVAGRVALIDDVVTTGATAEACARELLGDASAHVVLAVLCATDRRDDAV